MKISVSLPAEDVAFLDEYVGTHDGSSRSAALATAVKLLREQQLGEEYALAWEEWYASEDAALWDRTSGDGIADEPGWEYLRDGNAGRRAAG